MLNITEAIHTLAKEYMEKYTYLSSVSKINSGLCSIFANDLVNRLGGESSELFTVEIVQFLINGEECAPFDREMLANFWPKVIPINGMTWDEWDKLSQHFELTGGYHIWTVYQRRHYDAEVPEGVDNFFDLPIFHRLVEDWYDHSGIYQNCMRIEIL